MKKRSYLDKHYKNCKEILQNNGEDLDKLLASFKYRINYAKTKEKKIKRPEFKIKVNSEIYFRFKMVSIVEDIHSKALLEAFMNYFVEGDEDLEALLAKLIKYHKRSFFSSTVARRNKIIVINKLNKLYALPESWWKKYSDLNNEEFDF